MTSEERYVLNPLVRWLKRQKAAWQLYKPRFGSSATGWDLEARRKNQDLLIEAKYIDGPFLGSFTGLVAAPLADRPQHFAKSRYRSRSHRVCWAIGSTYSESHLYQILLDYLSRNPRFWKHYGEDLRMKYVFFARDGRVARIEFRVLLSLVPHYRKNAAAKRLRERQAIAAELLVPLIKYT